MPESAKTTSVSHAPDRTAQTQLRSALETPVLPSVYKQEYTLRFTKMKRLRMTLILLLPALVVASAWALLSHSSHCSPTEVCTTLYAPSKSQDQATLKWLASALRQYPQCNTFTVVQHNWSLPDYLDGNYNVMSYDRKTHTLMGISYPCGCDGGWEQVTEAKIEAVVAKNGDFFALEKLGCPSFP